MSARRPVLCLGEAIVDLVGRPPGRPMGEIRDWTPHPGGTVANIAAVTARAGTPARLAGAVGDDAWGGWVRERLAAYDVDVAALRPLGGTPTQLAFVELDAGGEPTYRLLFEAAETLDAAIGHEIDELVDAAGALLISTNTLAGPGERGVTLAARDRALGLGRPVVFDCNLRLHRWSSSAAAAAAAAACVPGAQLVRANHSEATLMTGQTDPERAAQTLLGQGARQVAITLGDGGAILRGEAEGEVEAVPVRVCSAMGAGDAFTGTLLAALAAAEFAPPAAAAALPAAARAAAEACRRWGALD